MESFEKLSDTFSRENQARLTATQVSINKIRTDIQSKKVAVDNAAEVTRKIQVLESQITELKSSNDYLSVQEMREFQMEIRFQETQIENLTSVQDQLKFAQRSCSFTKVSRGRGSNLWPWVAVTAKLPTRRGGPYRFAR